MGPPNEKCPPKGALPICQQAGEATNTTSVQRWTVAMAAKNRRVVIDDAEAWTEEALRIIAEIRCTAAAPADDFERWDLVWQLQGALHAAGSSLLKLVQGERAAAFAPFRRAS